jgi:hypothetical protein
VRRRFGRRRDSGRREPTFDVARALDGAARAGLIPAEAADPQQLDEIPATLAGVGSGVGANGRRVVVGIAPESGLDATLATLAYGARLASEEGFDGEAVALAPQWSDAARRCLALVGALPFHFRAVPLPLIGDRPAEIPMDAPLEPSVVSVRDAIRQVASARDRALLERASESLLGLAAKHGGSVRGSSRGIELSILARRAAILRAADGDVSLETLLPRRSREGLDEEKLAAALDGLEGNLRKLLNDRRLRDGEEGLRARTLPGLIEALDLRSSVRWPEAGSDASIVDLVGVDAEGRPVVAAVRAQLGLAQLGSVLGAFVTLRPLLPAILANAEPPVRFDSARLVLAADRFEPAVERVLGLLRLDVARFEIHGAASRVPALVARPADESARPVARAADERRDQTGERRDRRPRRPRASEPAPGREPEERAQGRRPERPREDVSGVEELSVFDLDDESEPRAGARSAQRRRRRGRGRRPRPRTGEADTDAGDDSMTSAEEGEDAEERPRTAASETRQRRTPARGRGSESAERSASDAVPDLEEIEDVSDALAPLPGDVPDFVVEAEPAYEDDEEIDEDADSEDVRMRREREQRRRARLAKAQPEPEPEPKPAPRPARRRAAIVAHADRDAVSAAVLLARDIRLLEGIWVYPQRELMTFFRSVATDLREETPIYVVGFAASPARDTIQAASLYRDRLVWIDHHEWPPEDLEAMRVAIGADSVHVTAGSGSSLPAVMALSSRRSRFSDKLVDAVTGRFTEHDFSRWGRLWWSRLGEAAQQIGDRRADLDPLLVGRPSDLARSAAKAPAPPLPAEFEHVSSRDFRVVHFGGYTMAVALIPAELDLHLTSRILRDRYEAQLSLTWTEGQGCVVLGGDEASSRRALDLGAMVEHLASKHEWIDALPDDDHVARFRVRDLPEDPDRIDAVVAEIAMGRSVLEG